jgi:hypothetical protein
VATTTGYDTILSSVLSGKAPTAGSVTTAVTAEIASLVARLPGLVAETPSPTAAFLVPDSATPGSGQWTETAFLRHVVEGVSSRTSAGSGTTADPATVTVLDHLFAGLRPLGTLEGLVRLVLDLPSDGSYDPRDVADRLAVSVADLLDEWDEAFTAPIDPAVWPAQDDEGLAAAPRAMATVAGPAVATEVEELVLASSGPFAKYGVPSTRDLGQRVHRFVQENYAEDFPDHFVVIEGNWKIDPAGEVERVDPDLLPTLDASTRTKVGILRGIIRFVGPIQPDIADLHDSTLDSPTKLDPWGWFEIKPIRSAIEGFEQLTEAYLTPYDVQIVLAFPANPEKRSFPGVWFPSKCAMVDVRTARIVLITRVLPGVVVYYTFKLDDLAAAMKAAIALGLLVRMVGAIVRKLGQVQPGSQGPELPVNPLVALVLVVGLALLVLASLPEEAVASLAVALAACAVWLGNLVQSVGGELRFPVFEFDPAVPA